LIRWIWAFIDRPLDRFDQAAAFWSTVTDSRLSTRRGSDDEFATFLPRSGHSSVKLQGVRGPGGAHLDLDVNDVPAAIDGARALGARVVTPHSDSAVMRSPGGQLFCLTPWEGAASPPPLVERSDGTSSRLDQVCLNVAPGRVRGREGILDGADRVGTPRRRATGVRPSQTAPRPADPHPAATSRKRRRSLRPRRLRLLGHRVSPFMARTLRRPLRRPLAALDRDDGSDRSDLLSHRTGPTDRQVTRWFSK